MSNIHLIAASLWFHRRTNLAVACGVAVGAAVLTGALLVGDSMRGSLRHLTLDRLGRIDDALVTGHFFRAALADEVAGPTGEPVEAAPAILLRTSLENADPQSSARANRVELIGCDARFWRLGGGGPRPLPSPHQIMLNRPLAQRLGVQVGDAVLLRLPRQSAIPADSALGRKQETIGTQRLVVSEIIAAEGLGRFSLRPTQQLPQNAYVPLMWLQERLEQPGGANAIFVAGSDDDANSRRPNTAGFAAGKVSLADYGLNVERTARGYWNITSQRMLIDPAAQRAILEARAARHATSNWQPALTYLANTLAANGRKIPYSTITAIDFAGRPPLGPFLSTAGKPLPPLGPNEIALNSWAAGQLHAKVGDAVRVTYFEPASSDGQVRETTVSLRLAAVVQLSGAADDRGLTPAVKGITDELTMAKWDPPFPFDAKRIRFVDEEYWDRYGPTPKAFVALATGRKLWGSRFGQTTSIRVANTGNEGRGARDEGDASLPSPFGRGAGGEGGASSPARQALTLTLSQRERGPNKALSQRERRPDKSPVQRSSPPADGDWIRRLQERLDPAAMGMVFQPIKRQGLAAAAGTTPFGVLFLCFSFFIIAAAVMLVAVLFRLGVELRASEIGTLLAVGLPRRQVRRLLLGEGLVVAAAGSLAGVPLGIGYAALLLLGLRTWWLAAVATPFLRLYLTAGSLTIGGLSGLAIALAVIWISVRQIGRVSSRRLLAGQIASERSRTKIARRPAWLIELVLIVAALAPPLVLLLGRLDDATRAGAFFASGAIALSALLALTWMRLKAGRTGPAVTAGGGNLLRMALRNAARNPGRSSLTIGLMASATFLIAAISAFRLDPNQQTPALHSGNGGFALVAESDQPILRDLNTPEGREQLGFSPQGEKAMAGSTVVALRVRAGDDASCRNLYRPRQPRVLGVPPALVERDGFAWADKPRGAVNPWLLLDEEPEHSNTKPSPLAVSREGATAGRGFVSKADGTACVPVILEKNTANYALNLWGGLSETFTISDGNGRPLRLRVVALLADSIFQGDLLIGDRAFLQYFPNTSGYRFFLVQTLPAQTTAARKSLERNLGDYGLAVETTGRRLADFLAVQNTYLSTFQSLGGLGLLLGTLGLAAVQLRSVLERRGELALLRAAGFSRSMLAQLVLLEHVALLLAGLAIGMAAAFLAVLPQLLQRGTPLPWALLAGTLSAVLVLGLAAGGFGARAVLRAPLLPSLREENL